MNFIARNAVVAASVTTALLASAAVNAQAARDQISIVGSSTVYPFATVVAEQFGRATDFKTPTVESTGSGGGIKLFCSGLGVGTPDIANSSRRIKDTEVQTCAASGVKEIVEVKIGYDGIVLANSVKSDPAKLTLQDVYLALAKEVPKADGSEALVPNPYQKWSDIRADLPNTLIEVMGPPPTSGTRDAFVELAMEGGCTQYAWIKALKAENEERYKTVCHTIREDGRFIEAGENDNLIVQKLQTNPAALGIFGYSFLDQNSDVVQGALINGVEPTFDNIADGAYSVSRPLYFYVKKAHVGTIPGIKEFVAEFTGERSMGEDGYLADRGLIPLPADEYAQVLAAVSSMANLDLTKKN
jgi:phosphate transport system substrate-binding protein